MDDHDRKVQEMALGLGALITALPPAVQSMRRCAQDVTAVADAAEGLVELCRLLLSQLGHAPAPPPRPELRAVPTPNHDQA